MDNPKVDRPEWRDMEESLNRIMSELTHGIDVATFVTLYTAVCDYCISPQPKEAADHPESGEPSSETLYRNLVTYLEQYLAKLKQRLQSLPRQQLLARYFEESAHYVNAAHIVGDVFQYLTRHWVKRELDQGTKSIYDVCTLHLVLWHSEVFGDMHVELMDALSELVQPSRSKDDIALHENERIKVLLEAINSFQIGGTDVSANTPDFYGSLLESPWRAAIETGDKIDQPKYLYPRPTAVIAHREDGPYPRLENLLLALKLESGLPKMSEHGGRDNPTIRLLAGDETIEADQRTTECSVLFERLAAYFGPTAMEKDPIPLPKVSGPVLRKVFAWCEHYRADPNIQTTSKVTAKSRYRLDEGEKWEQEYFNIDNDMLFSIIKTANYLDIKPLLDRSCQQVAKAIIGKSPAEIRTTFKIEHEFAREEGI